MKSNDLRAIQWYRTQGSDGWVIFRRTNKSRKYHMSRYSVHAGSKSRFLHTVRRYAKNGYDIVPNFTGWALVVKK